MSNLAVVYTLPIFLIIPTKLIPQTRLGNASLFTKFLFTILVPLGPPPPNQQSNGFPLEFLWKGLKQNCKHWARIANKLSQNCERNYEQTQQFTYGVVREGVVAEIMSHHISVPKLLSCYFDCCLALHFFLPQSVVHWVTVESLLLASSRKAM